VANDKLPPHDPGAEEAVLGCILLDSQSIYKVVHFLKPEDFFREANQWIYQTCLELTDRGEPLDERTLAHELARKGKLEAIGGEAYLVHLLSSVPSHLYIEHYAQIVYRLSKMRQLIAAGGQIAAIGYEAGPDIDEALDRAEDILFRLRTDQSIRDFIPLRQVLDQYLEEVAQRAAPPKEGVLPHIFTGYSVLDEWLGGLQRADLIILAARPSLGKTSLALGIVRNAAMEYNAKVAVFSLEMSREAIAERLLAGEAGVDTRRLRLGLYNEEEERKLMDAAGVLSEAHIYIDDTPQIRITELRSKARRLHYQLKGLDLIVVDYLQLVQGGGRAESRVQEIGQISRSLKALARELEVPVLAVSQLSRAPEWRASHRPQLSDLRESGNLEQDADIVLFIYRDDVYYTEEEWLEEHPTKPYPKGIAQIIIAKHRNGPTGEVSLRFIPRLAKFTDLETKKAQHETLPGFSE